MCTSPVHHLIEISNSHVHDNSKVHRQSRALHIVTTQSLTSVHHAESPPWAVALHSSAVCSMCTFAAQGIMQAQSLRWGGNPRNELQAGKKCKMYHSEGIQL